MIKVRTIKRKPYDVRWKDEPITNMRATPRIPNVQIAKEADPEKVPKKEPLKVEVGGEGNELPATQAEESAVKTRDFKITKTLLEKHGYTPVCLGCDQAQAGKRVTGHSKDCRARLEGLMQNDEGDQARLQQRDVRKGLDQKGENDIEIAENEELPEDDEPVINDDEEMDSESSSSDSSESEEPKEPESKKRRLSQLAMARRIGGRLQKPGSAQRIMKLEKMAVALNKEERRSGRTRMKEVKPMDITELMNNLMNLERPTPHETEEEEKERYSRLYEDLQFIDDVHTGTILDKEAVIEARILEIDFFKRMKVYEKVPRWMSKGKKVISTRWVDTNKVDESKPDIRCRLVGREIKYDKRTDLYAATPPLEMLRILVAKCVKRQTGDRPLRIATIDVKRAYFNAPAGREIYIEIPVEDRMPGDEGKVARLRMSLYGTRDAAQNWMKCYTDVLTRIGFQKGRASVCNFHHSKRNIFLTCHGDDFLIVAAAEDIAWLNEQMKKAFEVKTKVLGPKDEEGCVQELTILNRTLRWTKSGIEYEPDARHAELLIKELG